MLQPNRQTQCLPNRHRHRNRYFISGLSTMHTIWIEWAGITKMITRERQCTWHYCSQQVTNIAQVLFSKDNLDGSVWNHNEMVITAQRGDYAFEQAYGLRPDGGRNEERGHVHSVWDPYSFFPDPDPDPAVEAGDQYGSGSWSNPDPGL